MLQCGDVGLMTLFFTTQKNFLYREIWGGQFSLTFRLNLGAKKNRCMSTGFFVTRTVWHRPGRPSHAVGQRGCLGWLP
jgi:hypothetical protein